MERVPLRRSEGMMEEPASAAVLGEAQVVLK